MKVKKNLSSGFIMLLLCIIGTSGSSQTKLINPHLPNFFLHSYVLPDGTIRIIGSEDGRNRELFYVDKRTDGSITEPVFFPETFGEIEFNFAGVDCKILPLKSGDLLMGINQGDCDYAPYPSLARFTIEGEVVWAISMEGFYFNSYVHKLTLVDSNIICMISDELDTLYFDVNGNEIIANHQYVVFDTVLTTNTGYFAAQGQSLFRLDEAFEKIDSVELDDVVRTISIAGDTLIVIATASSLVMLDENLDQIVHSAVFKNFDLVTQSNDWIWIGRQNGSIIQLDYLLEPHDTITMPRGIQLKSMVVINEVMTVGGNYLSVTGSSIFVHVVGSDQVSFPVQKDIAMIAVNVSQPIFYSFEPFAIPWGFNIPYKNVTVTVSNIGYDTIQALTILYGEGSGCSFCEGEDYGWDFDSLNLLPGTQMDFALGDFSVWCVTQTPTKFCLSIFPADSLPETDQLNNRLCVNVDAFLTSVHESVPSVLLVSPNPADAFLAIRLENADNVDYNGVIVNGNGLEVERFKTAENNFKIETTDFLPGFYILKVINSEGAYLSKKFLVIH